MIRCKGAYIVSSWARKSNIGTLHFLSENWVYEPTKYSYSKVEETRLNYTNERHKKAKRHTHNFAFSSSPTKMNCFSECDDCCCRSKVGQPSEERLQKHTHKLALLFHLFFSCLLFDIPEGFVVGTLKFQPASIEPPWSRPQSLQIAEVTRAGELINSSRQCVFRHYTLALVKLREERL